jgi:hypothetical protein
MSTLQWSVSILQWSVTAFIGLVVAWVGFQQHVLAREKLKLDLFEKRFAVYKAAQRFLSSILTSGALESNAHGEFRRDNQDAVFLFGPEIEQYLTILDHKALDMRSLNIQFRPLPVGEERTRLCEQEGELLKQLTSELPKLKEVFDPYLRFKVWK